MMIGQSNEGKEFWLGFMEHRDAGQNTMVVLITSRVNTSGTISIPGRNFEQSFTVAAKDVTEIELPRFVETIGSEFVNDNAIKIIANDDISVYMHQYFGMRSEASIVLPTTSIGDAYYVVSYTGVPQGFFGPGIFPPEFLIVATQDETIISITLTADTQRRRRAGTTYQITLNAGEVYQVRGEDHLDDMTGTLVSGNKDFSLFAGTPWSQVPLGCTAMDNILEQMYPISTWGTQYVASSFAGTNQDLYRVIASEDNTSVRIEERDIDEIILNAGEFYDFLTPKGAFIVADKPISVAQYITGSACNGGLGDPSMVILNTVEQIRDTVTLFNSGLFNISQNFINVITKAGEEDLVFLDNINLLNTGTSFTSIGKDGLFVYASIPTSEGAHTLHTRGCGLIAMAYGYGDLESYAYSGGASFVDINENPIPDGGCLNDTIIFDTGLPADRYQVIWDLGDETITTEHQFEHQYPDLGMYPLSLIIEDICFDRRDTIYRDLLVTLRQDLFTIEDQSGCVGTEITLGAFDIDGARFEWTGPLEYEEVEQFPTLKDIQINQAGLYQVVGNISGCKTIPLEVGVEVFENPTPTLGQDTVLCVVDQHEISLAPGNYDFYNWQDNSDQSTFIVNSGGEYIVEVEDFNQCFGRDTIIITPQCPTRLYVPNVFSPNNDGVNDFFGVVGVDIVSMELNVYDRWGQLVFQSEDEHIHWDGTFENSPLSLNQYVWTLDFVGYKENGAVFEERRAGSILLVR